MKVVLLGKYPSYSFHKELGLSEMKNKRVTSWNENLLSGLSKLANLEVHFITSSTEIKKTTTIKFSKNVIITFIYIPPKVNTLTLYKYLEIKAKKTINHYSPDIVHGIGTEHIWGKIALNYSKHVITVHGVVQEVVKKNNPPYLSFIRYFAYLEKKILNKTKNLIIINPYVKNILDINSKANLFYVENAISKVYMDIKATPHNSKTILFIGDVVRRKNILDLLKSLAILYKNGTTDFKLCVVGMDVEKTYVDEVNMFLDENIYLKDLITRDEFLLPMELSKRIKNSAMLVLSSNEETAPMVIAESMSAGLPVISSDVGGIKHMINHGSDGYIIDFPFTPDQLSDKIKKLLESKSLRKEMGEEAKKNSTKRYNCDFIAKQTFDVYKKIMEN